MIIYPKKILFFHLSVLTLVWIYHAALHALPELGHNSAEINNTVKIENKILNVQTTQAQSTYQWNSFNIRNDEMVHFQQPSSTSIALNQISEQNGFSEIYGKLTSNGHVVLSNPAGIFFAAGSVLDVAGLIASTAKAEFRNGQLYFKQEPVPQKSMAGTVWNKGHIKTMERGLVALLAPTVINEGSIEARLGKVVLASGSFKTIDFFNDGFVQFAYESDENVSTGYRSTEATYRKENIFQSDSGRIIADGGKIVITSQDARAVMKQVVNLSGVIQADAMAKDEAGNIILSTHGKYDKEDNSSLVIQPSAMIKSDKGKIVLQGKDDLTTRKNSLPHMEIKGTLIAEQGEITIFPLHVTFSGHLNAGDKGYVNLYGFEISSLPGSTIKAHQAQIGLFTLNIFNTPSSYTQNLNLSSNIHANIVHMNANQHLAFKGQLSGISEPIDTQVKLYGNTVSIEGESPSIHGVGKTTTDNGYVLIGKNEVNGSILPAETIKINENAKIDGVATVKAVAHSSLEFAGRMHTSNNNTLMSLNGIELFSNQKMLVKGKLTAGGLNKSGHVYLTGYDVYLQGALAELDVSNEVSSGEIKITGTRYVFVHPQARLIARGRGVNGWGGNISISAVGGVLAFGGDINIQGYDINKKGKFDLSAGLAVELFGGVENKFMVAHYRGIAIPSNLSDIERGKWIQDYYNTDQDIYCPAIFDKLNQANVEDRAMLLAAEEYYLKGVVDYMQRAYPRFAKQGNWGIQRNFTSPMMLYQNLYSNTYSSGNFVVNYTTEVTAQNLPDLNSSKSIFVSTSDFPQHALKYAYGLKKLPNFNAIKQEYQEDGTPKHPVVGLVYTYLHTAKELEDSNANHVQSLHESGHVDIHPHIIHENETSFPVKISKQHIVDVTTADYLKLTGPDLVTQYPEARSSVERTNGKLRFVNAQTANEKIDDITEKFVEFKGTRILS